MRYHAVARIGITDPGWVESYVREVTPLVRRYGGRYLARTPRVEWLEGERAAQQVFLLVEWPSREAAMEFYRCEEYLPYRESRIAGARNELVLVPAEDVTGAANIAR